MKKFLTAGFALAIGLLMLGNDAMAQRTARTTTRKHYRKTYRTSPRNPNAARPVPGGRQAVPPGQAKKTPVVTTYPRRTRKVTVVPAPPPGHIPTATPPGRPGRNR